VTGPSAALLELVGVAGTGKTTLLRALKQRQPGLQTDLRIGQQIRLKLLIRHVLRFLPAFLAKRDRGRWLSWDELRAMGELEGWQRLPSPRSSPRVFDHGPIFRLVQLQEFGPPLVARPDFGAWWTGVRQSWARALDLVVWLDAPDDVLLPRINTRDQRHVVKHQPEATAVDFLTRYRRGYDKLLREMEGERQLRVLRFDTSRVVPERIADDVVLALDERPVALSR